MNRLINKADAAQYLGVSVRTLEAWISKGTGTLPYVKIGRMVRYRMDDLAAFIEAGRISPADNKEG